MGQNEVPPTAPDHKRLVESLDYAQILYILTVWNEDDTGEAFSELMLFMFDRYDPLPPGRKEAVAREGEGRFFSEEAREEYTKYGVRKRYLEYQAQMREHLKETAEALREGGDRRRILLPGKDFPINGNGN